MKDRFVRLIRQHGPITIQHYMGEANALYYASRDPLGGAGDFVTAPEISQMFGELIGLALADVWDRAGRPADAVYVELGPGRGTLARDALRAMANVGLTPRPVLVEASPTLRAIQAQAIPTATFANDADDLPDDAPLLIVANEFFDALPIRQLVRTASGWRERMVGLAGDNLTPIAGDKPMHAAIPKAFAEAPAGAILETNPAASAIAAALAARLARQGGAALAIDYGYPAPRLGSSFQAVRAHAKVDPFATPGEADLTAHVDFAALAKAAARAGARVDALTEQGAWLRALGIEARAAALARARPDQAEAVAAALARLTEPQAMGSLFKVLAFTAPHWPPLPG